MLTDRFLSGRMNATFFAVTDDKLIITTTGLKPGAQMFAPDKAVTDWTKEASVTGQFN